MAAPTHPNGRHTAPFHVDIVVVDDDVIYSQAEVIHEEGEYELVLGVECHADVHCCAACRDGSAAGSAAVPCRGIQLGRWPASPPPGENGLQEEVTVEGGHGMNALLCRCESEEESAVTSVPVLTQSLLR